MPSPAFTLRVPSRPPFRGLACDLVSRYIELRGGTEGDRAAFTTALAEAMDGLAGAADAEIELSCVSSSSGFDIVLRCDGRSSIIRHPLRAVKP